MGRWRGREKIHGGCGGGSGREEGGRWLVGEGRGRIHDGGGCIDPWGGRGLHEMQWEVL